MIMQELTQGKSKKAVAVLGAAAMATASVIVPTVTALADDTKEPSTGGRALHFDVSGEWFGQQGKAVSVSLLANGEVVDTIELNKANAWKHTFDALPDEDANGVVEYAIKPAAIDGYKTKVNGSMEEGFTIINMELPSHVGFTGDSQDISVNKTWVGDKGNKAKVLLLLDGHAVDEVELNQSNKWAYSFEDMPLVTNMEGKQATYTVAEIYEKGYVSMVSGNQDSGFTVSNVQEQAAPVEGTVIVRYVDSEGKEISYRQTYTGVVGEPYKDERKDIQGYKFKKTTGSTSGLFEMGVTEIVHVFEKVASEEAVIEGQVVSLFVDDKGKEIAMRSTVSGKVDAEYEVKPKEIPGYKLLRTDGTPAGKYTPGVRTVSFVYAVDEKADAAVVGGVVVKYVDKNGKEIAERQVLSGKIGEPYSTSWREIKGFGLVESSKNTSGKFAEGISIVTYTYDAVQEDVAKGNVVVKYVDVDGKDVAPAETLKGKNGEKYSAKSKTIEGYEFVRAVGDVNGSFSDTTRTVEFLYKKKVTAATEGKALIRFVDEGGREIAKPVELTGKIGETFTYSQKDIDGYTPRGSSVEGVYTADTQSFSFTYVKKDGNTESKPFVEGDVVVRYVDAAGKAIAEPVVHTGKVGSDYKVDSKAIEGYILKSVEGEKQGEYMNGTANVTFVYEKVPVAGGDLNVTPPAKPEVKPDPKPDVSPEPETKPEPKPETTPESKPQADSNSNTSTDSGQKPPAPFNQPPMSGTDGADKDADSTSKNNAADTSRTDSSKNAGSTSKEQTVDPDDTVKGKRLADTATNTFNWLVAGLGMLALSIGGLFVVKRRQVDEESVSDTE